MGTARPRPGRIWPRGPWAQPWQEAGAQVSSGGGCAGEAAPWEDHLVARGKGVFLLSLQSASLSQGSSASPACPRQQQEQKEPLGRLKGCRGLDPAWNHLQCSSGVLCQPSVVAGAAQVSPLQQGLSLLAAGSAVK